MLINRTRVRPGEQSGHGRREWRRQLRCTNRQGRGRQSYRHCGTEDKLQKAREIGADNVLNHYTEDIVARVRELTAGQGVDVIVVHVGAAVWLAMFSQPERLWSAGNLWRNRR